MPTFKGSTPTVGTVWNNAVRAPWVGPCPPDEEGAPTINGWIYTVARASAKQRNTFGNILTAEQAEDFIRANLTRPEKGNEVRRAVAKAYSQTYTGNSTSTPRVEFEPYNPELLAEIASHVPFEVTDDWLAEHSPESVLDVSPAQFLDALFEPWEFVAVKRHEADLGFTYQPGVAALAKELNTYVEQSNVGAWYYANPIAGTRRESGACYGDDKTSDFRNLMVESDDAPKELWLAMVVQMRSPILALYESGGRSVHAIIRVEASKKEEFDKIAANYKRQLVPLGMCKGSGKATQATRLPGVYRANKGRYQKLLYLAPDATGEPILKRTTVAESLTTVETI
jgi:hypothetical protein